MYILETLDNIRYVDASLEIDDFAACVIRPFRISAHTAIYDDAPIAPSPKYEHRRYDYAYIDMATGLRVFREVESE